MDGTAQFERYEDDEIDLRELFAKIWAFRGTVLLCSVAAAVLGVLIYINSEKVYASKTVFVLETSGGGGFSLGDGLGALAGLAGITAGGGGGDSVVDRLDGRDFILELNDRVDLVSDPYFNRSLVPPSEWSLGALIRRFFPTDKEPTDAQILAGVVRAFRDNVSVNESKLGATTIEVMHTNPERAAVVVNGVIDLLSDQLEREERQSRNTELSYLSGELAQMLAEMNDAQDRLKSFSIENSTLSIETLIGGSVALDTMRGEKERADALLLAAKRTAELVGAGRISAADLQQLRTEHPEVDDIEFRRAFGMSEVISQWQWPTQKRLNAVVQTLDDRSRRLANELMRLEAEASEYAQAAEELARLKREVAIAEASYKVMIEQVKARSVAAGLDIKTLQVYEHATPAVDPEKPKLLIVALSLVLGFILGVALALLRAVRRDAFFSLGGIENEMPGAFLLSKYDSRNGGALRKIISGKKLDTQTHLVNLNAMARKADANLILAIGTRKRSDSGRLATEIAKFAGKSGHSVAYVDLLHHNVTTPSSEAAAGDKKFPDGWRETFCENGVSFISWVGSDAELPLLAPKFSESLSELAKGFDLVFMSADMQNADMALVALADLKPVVLAEIKVGHAPKSLLGKAAKYGSALVLLHE